MATKGMGPTDEIRKEIESLRAKVVELEAKLSKLHVTDEEWKTFRKVASILAGGAGLPVGSADEKEVDPGGGIRRYGLRTASGDGPNDGDWSDELNERRIELIDKDIQGNITSQERAELAELQSKAVAYRDRVAPLPIEGARRLHQQLLEMKRQREGS